VALPPATLASLVHWQIDVTASADSSMSHAGDESRRGDGAQTTGALQTALHAALSAQAADLATRWKVQSRRILLLDTSPGDDLVGHAPDANVALGLVNALLAAFAIGDEESEAAAVATGLQFGVDAFARGASLHHTARAVDVLIAMVMHAMEKVAADTETSGSVAAGIWLARRLQSRAGLLSLAVMRGYTQTQADTLRDQFRHLRHDLRNPLGTIKSVLALMDDESVPAEARANANFRAMAKRNARSLEEMIADRLGDTSVPLPAMVDHDVSVQTVAQSVRRELRSEAERRGVRVLIDATELRGRFDVPGLELLLQAVLEAALQESRTGEQIHLTFDENGEGRVAIGLSHKSSHVPIERRNALDRLAALARRIGASVTFADPIVISLPMHGGDRETQVGAGQQVPGDTIESGVAEVSHNLRSPREDDHGQANVL
jgi:signal transduction histidine kinase